MNCEWQTMDTAPRGGFPEGYTGPNDTRNPAWVQPPRILALVDGQPMIVYWDAYYAEGGNGYDPRRTAWVNAGEGESLWTAPTHWMPLPAPPRSPGETS